MIALPPNLCAIRRKIAGAGALSGSWGDVIDHFRWVDVEIDLDVPGSFQWQMSHFVALRGAVGEALGARFIHPVSDPLDIPGANFLMFRNWETEMAKGLPYPKPFLLQVEQGGATVRIRLFGPLMAHASEVSEALTRALTRNERLPLGRAYSVVARRVFVGQIAPGDLSDGENLALWFLTPLSMRHHKVGQDAPLSVLRGIHRRLSGILAWYGIGLPLSVSEMHQILADRFSGAYWARGAARDAWKHPTARQRQIFPERGLVGLLNLNAHCGDLAPFFKLGEVVHAGGKAAIGCGRFEMVSASPDL